MSDGVIHVLLPVYNEGRSIYDLLEALHSSLSDLPNSANVLVVDDCSTDDSAAWIDRACQDFDGVAIRSMRHGANMGLHGALNTGLAALENIEDDDVLVTMDGDNTHSPRLIAAMLQKLGEGADIAIASRYCAGSRVVGVSRFRRLLSWGARWLYWVRWRIPGVKDYTSLFRAYNGRVVREFLQRTERPYLSEEGFTVTTELLRKMTPSSPIIVEVPMVLSYFRKANTSNMRIGRTIMQTLIMLLKN